MEMGIGLMPFLRFMGSNLSNDVDSFMADGEKNRKNSLHFIGKAAKGC